MGTVARTAVVAGTVNAVGQRHQERVTRDAQAAAWREDEAARRQQAPPPSADRTPTVDADLIAQLENLGRLRETGVLTDEEFAVMKAKLIGTS
jgi:hypothetical protein